MPDIASLGVTAYDIGATQLIASVPCLRNEHYLYRDAQQARISAAWMPDADNPVLHHLQGAQDASGNALYLPYELGKISSVRLPIPPPAGVDWFLTANMSGCKFFIDQLIGSQDLVVYHANTTQYSSPPHSPANFQDPQAIAALDQLHANARADYAAAPDKLALVSVASLAKGDYYGVGALAEQRKADQGRSLQTVVKVGKGPDDLPVFANKEERPEFSGGCSIMGFYSARAWTFYYQTFGTTTYDRPMGPQVIAQKLVTGHWHYVHKARVEGQGHKKTPYKYYEVVEYAQFYP